MRLITRGDDAGLGVGVNRAIVETVERGLVRNVSVMVQAPAFADAATRLRALPEVCVGLHVTLTSEWVSPRWGPVLRPDRVPSLVEADGCFPSTTLALHRRGPVLGELIAEVRAQLDLARAHGLPVAYLDEHMGVGWLPGVRSALEDLAQVEGLMAPDGHVPFLPEGDAATGDPVDDLVRRLRAATDGDAAVLITHPGYDDAELRTVYESGGTPGGVARERDGDRRALRSARVRRAAEDAGITPTRYVDLQAALAAGAASRRNGRERAG